LGALAARVLSGIGSMTKERGNLPAARASFREALDFAEASGDRDTLAMVHGGLLSLEQSAGNLLEALGHGWIAVEKSESDVTRARALATLAGALGEFGDREAAEDAWAIVARTSPESYYRIYAHDALAHLAALRGDPAGFDEQARLCDALDWHNGPRSAKAEILYYRGLSCRELGRLDQAAEWLEQAVAFAEEHSFNQLLFDAEEALRTLPTYVSDQEAPVAAPPTVRDGVRALREELVLV
jgi:tetratricopeptide (TPR) repeat protein